MEKNKMKEEYNILSQKLNKVITLIEEIKPNWPKMDNIVDTYNNKINDIEENLNKHSISLWSDNFELGKAIDYDLKEKMSSGLHNSIILTAKTIKISEENLTKASKKKKNKRNKKIII